MAVNILISLPSFALRIDCMYIKNLLFYTVILVIYNILIANLPKNINYVFFHRQHKQILGLISQWQAHS